LKSIAFPSFLVTRQERTKETRPDRLAYGYPGNAISRGVVATGLPAPGPLNPHPCGLTPSKSPFPAIGHYGGYRGCLHVELEQGSYRIPANPPPLQHPLRPPCDPRQNGDPPSVIPREKRDPLPFRSFLSRDKQEPKKRARTDWPAATRETRFLVGSWNGMRGACTWPRRYTLQTAGIAAASQALIASSSNGPLAVVTAPQHNPKTRDFQRCPWDKPACTGSALQADRRHAKNPAPMTAGRVLLYFALRRSPADAGPLCTSF